jgi:hypothetical protein
MTPPTSDPITPDARFNAPPQPPRDAIERPAMVNATRVVETRQFYPIYIIPLAALTAAFLAVQLAFASHLLDAMGAPIGERQLAALESWGWLLSGVALTLLAWGSFVLPQAYRGEWPVRHTAAALLIAALVCSETVFLVGPGLIGASVDRMTGAERRCAVQLRVLAAARQDDIVQTVPPAIQWAILRAPFSGLSCDGLPAASREGLAEALQGMVARQAGTADQVYNNIFIPSVRSLRDAYNEYVAAQLRLVADIRAIPDQQAQAWQHYLDRLARGGLAPARVPRRDWPRVAAETRDAGVQVPADWNPADQATFMDAVAMASRKSADATYGDFVMKHFQQALPPGMDWETFCGQPTIQTRWRLLVDVPSETVLTPAMGFPAFRQTVYQPRIDRLVEPSLDDLLAAPDAFAPSGAHAQAGRAAAFWVSVPAVLLDVAVLCILWHAVRLVDLICCLLLPRVRAPRRWAAEACVAVAAVILFMTWRTPHSGSSGAARPVATVSGADACSATGGDCDAGAAVGLLRPVGATMRNIVLFGFDFGYDPGADGDAGEDALGPLLPRIPQSTLGRS